jgi:hypothetical protein
MNMTKRRLLLLAALPLVIVVTLGVLAMLPPNTRPGVTKANFDRIEIGMTMAEVEEILGGKGKSFDEDDKAFMYWDADDGSLATIRFVDNCVPDKTWYDSDETIPDKIRRWLHLR